MQALENDKRSSLSEIQVRLTDSEHKLSNALSEKHDMEKSYQDEISAMKTELKLQTTKTDNLKEHHAKIVDNLKSDLTKARIMREENAISLQKEMEEMKRRHDESTAYYKYELDELRAQLRTVKDRAEADRKEWTTNTEPGFVRKLAELSNERDELAAHLSHAREDISRLKSVRDKDIELLEGELDKTYKSKVETDAELKDVKRQLDNALKSLDEMMADGGKMRCDFEGAMDDITTERSMHQKEIANLKSINVDQQSRLDNMLIEKERYESNCVEMRQSVKDLEERLLREMRAKDEYLQLEKGANFDALRMEIEYLKNKLEDEKKRKSVAASASDSSTEQLHTQVAEQAEIIESLRSAQSEMQGELSRAKQTNQILKSKERYLESRVESLANQISQTVQDYEARLSMYCSVSISGSGSTEDGDGEKSLRT